METITAKDLSKKYRIGALRKTSDSLRDTVSDFVGRRFRRLTGSGVEGDNEDIIWALRDVSFTASEGEVLGIVGKNGAGKSTLLKVLSRITSPTSGEVVIRGRVASLLEVGTGFHPELTGRENVFLNGAILGMTRAEIRSKFDEIVSFSEIEKFIDTPVKRYSSGMYVRLAFAVAAHLDPEVLLVDEVLAVGDMGFQKKCLGKMDEVSRQGRTVLIVSHNMPVITNLCRRAILLHDGRIVGEGAPHEVVERYLSSDVDTGCSRTWDPADAPGDEKARLRSVRILQPGREEVAEEVDISRDVEIEISYECLRQGARIYHSIWLHDHLGTAVLASSNAKGFTVSPDEWYDREHSEGVYRSVCRIPANFLNDISYHLTVILAEMPDRIITRRERVLSFNVVDTGEMRSEYYDKMLGVVRPRLDWRTEKKE